MHRSRSLSTRRRTERGRRSGNLSSSLPARRRTRQRRRDGDDTSSTPSPKKPHTHRPRYVKSKPPKAMPGGRVISSGEGTLTEVSKSFYVAYGSTSLGPTATDIHLVVPVNDELQEITDDDARDELAPTKSNEMPMQDFVCGSLMESPRLSLEDKGCAFGEDPGLPSVMQACLPSEPMPMNWYSTQPWSAVKPSTVPFTTPQTDFATQMPCVSEFGTGMFGDVFRQATRDPSPITQAFPASTLPGTHSTNKPDIPAPVGSQSVVSDAPKSQCNDYSYFHLAEALMPETKQAPRGRPHRSSYSPPYWDTMSPRFRCGQGEMASMMGFHNNPYPPNLFQPLAPWEADFMQLPSMGPPFSSLSSHQRRYSEINPRPLTASFYSEQPPFFRSHSNLLI